MSDPTHDPSTATSDAADAAALEVPRPPEARPAARGPAAALGTFVTGFAMGAADVVPGFSGGTVALVAGIYQRLIANVRQGARALSLLLRLRGRDGVAALAAIEWTFVAALGFGIATAIIALAGILEVQLDAEPVAMSALFLGLVLGATLVAVGELRAPAPRHLVIAVAVAAATFLGLGVGGGTIADPSLVVLFAAGAVAVCAMILPGVSGAFLLVLIGVYQPVLGAVGDGDLVVLAVVGAGCVVGLASFSTLLNWLLAHHHDVVLAALLGLMAGSARVLWPWPSAEGMGDPTLGAPRGEIALPVALALSGALVVIAVGLVTRGMTRRRSANEPTP